MYDNEGNELLLTSLSGCPQAMERRYTALADQQGQLAAEKEKLSSEKHALMEVRQTVCTHACGDGAGETCH